ncbi:MAG: guanitoxin biosynthesis pre-guanitoxin forming N-methyltransferase GntF [Chloroflexota bacterium]
MVKTPTTDDWENDWSAQAYLNQYYRTPTIPGDERAIFNFFIPYLRSFNTIFPQALDIGAGPTLHHELALVPFIEEFHIADYLPQNLAEIQKWLDDAPGAHDWDIYSRGILAIEGQAEVNDEAVEARKRLLRQRVTTLKIGNIRDDLPLGEAITYPLVTAFYVACSVARTKAEWMHYMRNVATLVAPGGVLIISALRNAEHYQVGPHKFPSANIDEHDVQQLFQALGFDTTASDVEVATVPEWDNEGFDSIIVARGRKLTVPKKTIQDTTE